MLTDEERSLVCNQLDGIIPELSGCLFRMAKGNADMATLEEVIGGIKKIDLLVPFLEEKMKDASGIVRHNIENLSLRTYAIREYAMKMLSKESFSDDMIMADRLKMVFMQLHWFRADLCNGILWNSDQEPKDEEVAEDGQPV